MRIMWLYLWHNSYDFANQHDIECTAVLAQSSIAFDSIALHSDNIVHRQDILQNTQNCLSKCQDFVTRLHYPAPHTHSGLHCFEQGSPLASSALARQSPQIESHNTQSLLLGQQTHSCWDINWLHRFVLYNRPSCALQPAALEAFQFQEECQIERVDIIP